MVRVRLQQYRHHLARRGVTGQAQRVGADGEAFRPRGQDRFGVAVAARIQRDHRATEGLGRRLDHLGVSAGERGGQDADSPLRRAVQAQSPQRRGQRQAGSASGGVECSVQVGHPAYRGLRSGA
jgi:hypothetical protein